ncbi:MAG: class I SAM-dependent methyltransferase, partial [Gemmataceae bacterium]
LAFVREWLPTPAASPGRLLDLGCGTGRLLAQLPTDWHGTGVDLSLPMLRQARAKAPQADLVQANLTQLDCFAPNSFDIAVCLFSTLGMIAPAAQRLQVLLATHRLLKPQGRLILHAHNRWFHLWTPAGRSWLLTGQREWVMPAHQGVTGLSLHQFTRRELLALLSDTGFVPLEVRPISLEPDGQLPVAWLCAELRCYGYLIAAQKGNKRQSAVCSTK